MKKVLAMVMALVFSVSMAFAVETKAVAPVTKSEVAPSGTTTVAKVAKKKVKKVKKAAAAAAAVAPAVTPAVK